MNNILVAEDDEKINRLYCAVLNRSGYRALSAANGAEALDIMEKEIIDLIITDIMMPETDGFELIKCLREAGFDTPTLIITAKHGIADKERGFVSGTDDYMVKPADVNEMVMRVGALLRRAKIATEKRIVINETVLDRDAFTLTFGGAEHLLPQKEFCLLYKLASYPNKIFTRQQLMDEIWGMDTETDERTVDVHINRLRERLKDNGSLCIVTVRGLGYKAVKS